MYLEIRKKIGKARNKMHNGNYEFREIELKEKLKRKAKNQRNQTQRESKEMRKERQRVKKVCLENARKLKRPSLETRPAYQSKKDTWPQCVPRRHRTINVGNRTPSASIVSFKKKILIFLSLSKMWTTLE